MVTGKRFCSQGYKVPKHPILVRISEVRQATCTKKENIQNTEATLRFLACHLKVPEH